MITFNNNHNNNNNHENDDNNNNNNNDDNNSTDNKNIDTNKEIFISKRQEAEAEKEDEASNGIVAHLSSSFEPPPMFFPVSQTPTPRATPPPRVTTTPRATPPPSYGVRRSTYGAIDHASAPFNAEKDAENEAESRQLQQHDPSSNIRRSSIPSAVEVAVVDGNRRLSEPGMGHEVTWTQYWDELSQESVIVALFLFFVTFFFQVSE